MNVVNKRPACRTGAVAVLVAFLLVVILGMVAFAVDIGYITLVRNRLQVAADAAAMAGAAKIGNQTDAIAAAKAAAHANIAGGPGDLVTLNDSDITFGYWNMNSSSFTPGGSPTNGCQVVAKRPNLPLFFAPVLGVKTVNVQAGTSTIAVATPRDIAFVIDLSGSMNNDSEIWATSAINGAFAGYPTIGSDTMQSVFTDFNFGTYPGITQFVGAGYVSLNSSGSNGYGNLVTFLTGNSTYGSTYKINSSDSADTKKTKVYKFIIDKQMATLMPNAVPALNSSTNLAYWSDYLDYILVNQGTTIPSQNSLQIDSLSNPYTDAWPSLTSSTISPFYNKVGYQTYVQFMMDLGRNLTAGGRNTPLVASSPDCPMRLESDTSSPGYNLRFPPREQPTHALKLAVMAGVNKIATMNNGAASNLQDHVAIITFDTIAGSQVVYPLSSGSCDYAAVNSSLRGIQAVGDDQYSTASEQGLQLAYNHLDPAQNSNARSNASKIIVFLSDGIANLKVSSNTTVDNYVAAHSGEWFSSSNSFYRERNAAMMQAYTIASKGWELHAVGVGLGCDRTLMDRIARLAQTAVVNPSNPSGPKISPYADGNPANYQDRLTAIFATIVKGRNITLVR